ncbi:hypothetical protein [Scytonema sp. PCC 10023]|uniref:hypothetical protein n=1 Tax=Scytonema sp. PCC 10023 TaxID=1680591 RepID=UPI0039C65714
MSSKSLEYLVAGGWLRLGLLLLAAISLSIGFWALLAPYHFYDIFPLSGRHWVSILGPYNEHLVRDYGATNLALGVLLVATAVLLERHLTQVALVSWLVFAVPHFLFHLTQTHHFLLFDNLTQLGSLGFVVLLPIVLLFFVVTQKG